MPPDPPRSSALRASMWFLDNQFSSEPAITLPGLSEMPKGRTRKLRMFSFEIYKRFVGICGVQMLCLCDELNLPPHKIHWDHWACWATSWRSHTDLCWTSRLDTRTSASLHRSCCLLFTTVFFDASFRLSIILGPQTVWLTVSSYLFAVVL